MVNLIKHKNIKLPGEILAFDLIRNARITKEERKLVMTAVDFEKKDDMYKATQISLRKFIGESYNCHSEAYDTGIKVENTYFANYRQFRGRSGAYQSRGRYNNTRYRSLGRGRGNFEKSNFCNSLWIHHPF